jgi:hypothetical protein
LKADKESFGFKYANIKELRTRLSEMINPNLLGCISMILLNN